MHRAVVVASLGALAYALAVAEPPYRAPIPLEADRRLEPSADLWLRNRWVRLGFALACAGPLLQILFAPHFRWVGVALAGLVATPFLFVGNALGRPRRDGRRIAKALRTRVAPLLAVDDAAAVEGEHEEREPPAVESRALSSSSR